MLLNQKASKEMLAAYHLQKVSGKFGRKVTGTRLLGSVFPVGMFQTEIRVLFLQNQFQTFAAVFR